MKLFPSSKKWQKKIATFLVMPLITALFQGSITVQAQSSQLFFKDLNGHWGQYYIEKMHIACGIDGYKDVSGKLLYIFRPDASISRAELVRMLVQCLHEKTPTPLREPFNDVGLGLWFTNDIARAKALSWAKGYSDGSFRPNTFINRAEATAMILRSKFSESEIYYTGKLFSDVRTADWFKNYVGYAFSKNYVQGLRDARGVLTGSFGPDRTLTRAEAAKIIMNMLNEAGVFDNNSSVKSFDEWWGVTYNSTTTQELVYDFTYDLHDPNAQDNTTTTTDSITSPEPTPTPVTPAAQTPTPVPAPPAPTPVPPGTPPVPVTGHPSLWLTANDIPRLRSWAVASNPIYQDGLKIVAERAKKEAEDSMSGKITADDGSYCCTVQHPREMYAMLFAYMSLIENDQAVRDDYANRAKTLLMSVMNEAVKGVDESKPYRSSKFSHHDRAHFWGESFALTVDWIYPYLSASDKATIRTVFLRWSNEIVNDGYTHPTPVGVLNSPSILHVDEPGKGTYRTGVNNHDTIFQRNLALMSMALDPADDANNQLRDYLKNATGAWLYRTAHVIENDLNPSNDPSDAYNGLSGDWPEGWQYTPSGAGSLAQFLLALDTKGLDDPAVYGNQVKIFDNAFFKNTVTAYIHSMSPVAVIQKDLEWKGLLYQPAWYGDGDQYFQEHSMKYFGALGLYYYYKNDTDMVQKIRWMMLNLEPGGAGKITERIQDTLGSASPRNAILAFMLFDPSQMNPPDPRPKMPTLYFGKGTNHLLARTSWNSDARWFTYKLTWNKIDHQHGDGNMFEFYRKGEWLTKNRVGYGPTAVSSDFHNTLTVKNDPPKYNNTGSYQNIQWNHGSQWGYIATGDPSLVAKSFTNDFVYLTGDATNLYNSSSDNANDVSHVSRSIVWLKPDHIVVYDRAASKTAGKFKRFWLNFQNAPTIAGKQATGTTPGGQKLFVNTLLPANATLSVDNALMNDSGYKEDAAGEIMKYRLKVEAMGDQEARFLHVLQGADAGATADSVALVQSSSGASYNGAIIGSTVVMFPVNLTAVTSVTYTVPGNITKNIVTGFTPKTGYTVNKQTVNGTTQISIATGGSTMSDGGGVLVF